MTDLAIEGVVPPWTLTDRLRKAREHRGLSQAELGRITGISARSVYNYEAGTTTPRRPQLLAWALATGVPLQWLEDECAIRDSNPEPADSGFDGLPRVTCPRRGHTSYHPDDVREGYCGACHDWTSVGPDDLAVAA